MPKLKIQKTRDVEDVSYSKKGDAAIDLRASGVFVINLGEEKKEIEQDSYKIFPGERILIKCGIQVEFPKGFWGNIRDRSGLALKHGLHNLGGVVDETYRGEICVIMLNTGKKPYVLTKNERIAQMVITPYASADIEYVDSVEDSERGASGFGDSGKH